MILENFKPFKGHHCETTATGSLLNQIGIELSEPMLFGVGEGLGFGYFYFKSMPHPFIGGRLRQGEITTNICTNLNLTLNIEETTSIKKAWKNVEYAINRGKVVGLQLDCYYLDYFSNKIHFAGHFVAMYGYDEHSAYLIDTVPQGTLSKTTLKGLELARNAKGSMSAKNKSYTIEKTDTTTAIEKVLKVAICNNASAFLNPPITNLGYKGILKASKEIKRWFETSANRKEEFQSTALLMEKGGTGGALFRNMYRDFLYQSYTILRIDELKEGGDEFREIALNWSEVARLLSEAGEKDDAAYINQASEIMAALSEQEKHSMSKLREVCQPS